MSVPLYKIKKVRTLLTAQIAVIVVAGSLFFLKDLSWGMSALAGGLAAFLPNLCFMFFAWHHQAGEPVAGRIAWRFAFGEACKVLSMVLLLIVALAVFKAAFLPLGMTWLSVMMVQIITLAVINNKG
ncbi:MAG: ATP synthase protein I [Candidatus Erwinia impunctatus]|nr:ATP synthase protein I [Culicoides impunctatus]